MKDNCLRFFLGANSDSGFVSFFNSLHNPEEQWFTYIIKGGPGTGKSQMIKKVAEAFSDKCIPAVLIPCSSDPNSLDGVMFPTIKVSVADGTAPHTLDPIYPGVSDTIVNLCDCWNDEAFKQNAYEIKSVSKRNKKLLSKAAHFISAAASLENDSFHIALSATDTSKVQRFVSRFAARNIPNAGETIGRETKTFLSAITPEGLITFSDNLPVLCDKIIVIDDEYGAASRMVLESVKASANLNGYDVISCYSPINPNEKLEHLIIEELKLGFFTSNQWHKANFKPASKINSSRFYNSKMLSQKSQRIGFNRRAAIELIDESISVMKLAKTVHDELEEYYIQNMDFDAVNRKTEWLIGQISERHIFESEST